MKRPIYILAGQSNANSMSDEFSDFLAAMRPPGSYYAEVFAINGAPLTKGQLDTSWVEGAQIRAQLIERIVEILRADPDAYLSDIIWVQGEGDTNSKSAEDYAEDIKKLVNEIMDALRSEVPDRLGDFEDFKFNIVQLSDHASVSLDRPYWDTVQDQQELAANTHDNIELIKTDEIFADANLDDDEIFSDGIHYERTAQNVLMEKILEQTMDIEVFRVSERLEVEDGYWVECPGGNANYEFFVRSDFECAGVNASNATGEGDTIVFDDTNLEDWVLSEHDEVSGRLVLEAKNSDAMLFVENARNIEFWTFQDDEMYTGEEMFEFLAA